MAVRNETLSTAIGGVSGDQWSEGAVNALLQLLQCVPYTSIGGKRYYDQLCHALNVDMNVTGKIERKYMAHYLDTEFITDKFSDETPSWYRIGEDLEEYDVELNSDTEVVKNILGNTKFNHNGYEPTADADPFYARVGDPLFDKLQAIVDNRHQGDRCKTSTLEVHLWELGSTATRFVAYRQFCYCVPGSYGGDTSGYQIPFSVNYVGERIRGEFVPNALTGGGKFIPAPD